MRLLLSLPIFALSFFVADVVANPHGSPHARRAHDAIARRAPGDVAVHLNKRFDGARFTFYDVGLGACGITNVPSDFIVALNSAQFGDGYPGPNCFKQITISVNGMTAVATITDECPGCPYAGLDFSRGLFDFFASESVGVLTGTWNFNDGSDTPPTTPAPPPATTTTPDPPPPTTTTPNTPTTTTTPPPPATSTSTSPPAYSPSSSTYPPNPASSSSSINYDAGPASNLAVPTGVTVSDNAPHNILTLNEVVVALGGMVVAGAIAE